MKKIISLVLAGVLIVGYGVVSYELGLSQRQTVPIGTPVSYHSLQSAVKSGALTVQN